MTATMRLAAASLAAVIMGLGLTGCGHSRNDDEDDDRPAFDQVGEVRVYNDRPKVAPVTNPKRTQPAQHEQRFDQIGEADIQD